jgi:hypothetical protein
MTGGSFYCGVSLHSEENTENTYGNVQLLHRYSNYAPPDDGASTFISGNNNFSTIVLLFLQMYRKIKVAWSKAGNCSRTKGRKQRRQNMQIHTCKIYVQIETTKKAI